MQKRTKFLMIRLTPDEDIKLKKIAKELEIYVACYVRNLLFRKGEKNE